MNSYQFPGNSLSNNASLFGNTNAQTTGNNSMQPNQSSLFRTNAMNGQNTNSTSLFSNNGMMNKPNAPSVFGNNNNNNNTMASTGGIFNNNATALRGNNLNTTTNFSSGNLFGNQQSNKMQAGTYSNFLYFILFYVF